MDEKYALAKVLFERNTIYLPQNEIESYSFRAALISEEKSVVIISRCEDEATKVKQEEIYARLISRMPVNDVSVHYMALKEISLGWMQAIYAKHFLLCGFTVFDLTNNLISPYTNISFDEAQVISVDDIVLIDSNPGLKVKMWQEWIRQFETV